MSEQLINCNQISKLFLMSVNVNFLHLSCVQLNLWPTAKCTYVFVSRTTCWERRMLQSWVVDYATIFSGSLQGECCVQDTIRKEAETPAKWVPKTITIFQAIANPFFRR